MAQRRARCVEHRCGFALGLLVCLHANGGMHRFGDGQQPHALGVLTAFDHHLAHSSHRMTDAALMPDLLEGDEHTGAKTITVKT